MKSSFLVLGLLHCQVYVWFDIYCIANYVKFKIDLNNFVKVESFCFRM